MWIVACNLSTKNYARHFEIINADDDDIECIKWEKKHTRKFYCSDHMHTRRTKSTEKKKNKNNSIRLFISENAIFIVLSVPNWQKIVNHLLA